MRARITILCGVLLFSGLFATPAQAGPWSAFVAWLSDLDPSTIGPGLEMTLWCPPKGGAKPGDTAQYECTTTRESKFVVKTSAAFQVGTLNETGGTIFVVPAIGIVEKQVNRHLYLGFGAGVLHVGGTLVGSVTQPLIQPVRVTLAVPKFNFGIRGEVNVLTNGFPAGAFRVGSPEQGAEVAVGISVVYVR